LFSLKYKTFRYLVTAFYRRFVIIFLKGKKHNFSTEILLFWGQHKTIWHTKVKVSVPFTISRKQMWFKFEDHIQMWYLSSITHCVTLYHFFWQKATKKVKHYYHILGCHLMTSANVNINFKRIPSKIEACGSVDNINL
jgi:hypothetical protein